MSDLSRFLPTWTNLLIIPGIIAGFTVHELGHTFVAYLLGDKSQVERGRITLNPFRHISWFGTFTFVLFGFGWARPVQVDPSQFKRRYLDMFLVAVAGASANLLLAGLLLFVTLLLVTMVAIFSEQSSAEVMGLLLNADKSPSADIVSWTAAFTTSAIYANLALAFFNLLPFPTLDGFTVLASLIGIVRSYGTESEQVVAGPTPKRAKSRTPAARPQPAEIHFQLGSEYHAQGSYEDAIARYRQAIANDRNLGPAYVNMGLAYLALNQRTQAIQAFRGATQYATDETTKREAWTQLHRLSESPYLNDEQEAPASQTTSVRLSTSDTNLWTGTGTAPNWLAFGVGSLVMLAVCGCLYIYLTVEMIRYLS